MMRTWRLPPFLCFFLVFIAGFIAVRGYYFFTDDLRLGNIAGAFSPHEEWQISPTLSDQELCSILAQSYHYVGKGAQCYAFASENGEYILKFFKFKHLRPSFFWRFLPKINPFLSWKQQEEIRKKERMEKIFAGYKLAYEQFSEMSQVVHLHLNPTEKNFGLIHFTDKMGRSWHISSQTTPFLIQRKGRILRSVLADYLDRGKDEMAKQALEKIFYMYLSEYRTGTYDRDHGVMHNTGFVGDRPFHLDVGKFCLCEKMRNVEYFGPDLRFVIWKMRAWLTQHYPEKTPMLIGHLAALYEQETGVLLNLDQVNPKEFQRKKKK